MVMDSKWTTPEVPRSESPEYEQIVGREFVRQYYTLLNKSPLYLHRFYSSESSFVHGALEPVYEERNGMAGGCGIDGYEQARVASSGPAYGQKDIHQRIVQLNFQDCKTKIRQVDAHSTLGNGVVVQVSGELSNCGQPMRRFMQTFVLEPQAPKKYFVRNDIFRYQDEVFSVADASIHTHKFVASRDEENNKQATVNTNGTYPVHSNNFDIQSSAANNADLNMDVRELDDDQENQAKNSDVGDNYADDPTDFESEQVANAGSIISLGSEVQSSSIGTFASLTVVETVPTDSSTKSPFGFVNCGQGETVISGSSKEESTEKLPLNYYPTFSLPAPNITTTPNQADYVCDEATEDPTSSEDDPPQQTVSPQPEKMEVPLATTFISNEPKTYANLVKSGTASTFNHILHVSAGGGLPPAGFTKPGTNTSSSPKGSGSGQTTLPSINGTTGQFVASGTNLSIQAAITSPGDRDGGKMLTSPLGTAAGFDRNQGESAVSPTGRTILNNRGSAAVTRGTPGGRQSNSGMMSKDRFYPASQQLFVGNLPNDCAETDLENVFEAFGKVAEIRIIHKPPGQIKVTPQGQAVPSFGFVVFESEDAVQECLQRKPIHMTDGHRLNVESKKNKQMRTENMGNNGGEYSNYQVVPTTSTVGRDNTASYAGGTSKSGRIAQGGTSSSRGGVGFSQGGGAGSTLDRGSNESMGNRDGRGGAWIPRGSRGNSRGRVTTGSRNY